MQVRDGTHLYLRQIKRDAASDEWDRPQDVASDRLSERKFQTISSILIYSSHRDPGEFARLKMALMNLLPADGTEMFKYQILVDHLKLEEARLIAESYLNSPVPYSDTMAALTKRFGQPHQIALRRISTFMVSPDIRRGDSF
ncbi:hypothetical protein DPEC_G00146250 [Dallia pectoralis]|uniref:Uncharacterized protein n=1 Tax=Dallia pectoralis TaxID=75939 RepID=A0ACC2GP44_DALPE|nr:hypothetical protein DPEC_G00146250 [Dallia pectoralis]